MRTLAGYVFIGAAAGAVAGALECLAALFGPSSVLTPPIWWEVAANWALVGAAAGLLAPPALLLFSRDSRSRVFGAACASGVVLFAPALLLHRLVLQAMPFGAVRILAYAAIAAAVPLLAIALSRLRLRTDRARGWGAALAIAGLVALGGLLVSEERDPLEGAPAVQVLDEAPPSVLFVVVDTLRADHLSLYGYDRETSPNLDAFAAGGLVFEQARAESSWTKPSVATILSGLPPLVHGQLTWRNRLPERIVTLPEYFLAGGHRTAAFSDNPVVSPVFGVDQGFEVFRWHSGWSSSRFQQGSVLGRVMKQFRIPDLGTLLKLEADEQGETGAAGLNRMFLEWLGNVGPDEPWFAYLHYMEPHAPYSPPGDFRSRFTDPDYPDPGYHRKLPKNHPHPWETSPPLPEDERQFLVDLYDGEIASWDDEFGRFLAELRRAGRLENTIVVVTSDHGEEFYDHGGWEHRMSLYDELIRIPLVLHGPGIAPERNRAFVSLRSLLPTLLRLGGIEPVDRMGFPYLRPLRGGMEGPVPQEAAHEPEAGRESFALLEGGRKWILSTSGEGEILECYDLVADPGELVNVADAQDPEHRRAVLDDIARRRRIQLEAREAGADAEPDEGMVDALRGMGYVK